MAFLLLREGLRMAGRARAVRKRGFKRYPGDAAEICRGIIEDCYDSRRGYFRVSAGHYCEFYARDFGWCAEALHRLGYEKEVRGTLAYALSRYAAAGRVTSAISPDGTPFDYFLPAGPDALAMLLYALARTGNHALARKHREFLQRMLDDFVQRFVDGTTLLPQAGRHYSSIRDQAKRKAPCYDAVMVTLAMREGRALGLSPRHTAEDVAEAIVKAYWNGTYFFQDLRRDALVVGDANVFPFWTGIITDKGMLEDATDAVRASGLDTPFPLRYVSVLDRGRERTPMVLAHHLSRDYETDSIWMHLGLAYLRVLKERDQDLTRRHLAAYTRLIERHRTFLEVFDRHGEPFRRAFYVTDEGMLWCANYLLLRQELLDE